jgi:hypothetical protein
MAAGVILILLSLWAYLAADKPAPTALIPAAAGALSALCAVLSGRVPFLFWVGFLCLITLALALWIPMRSALGAGDMAGQIRIGAMMITALAAAVSAVSTRRAAGG